MIQKKSIDQPELVEKEDSPAKRAAPSKLKERPRRDRGPETGSLFDLTAAADKRGRKKEEAILEKQDFSMEADINYKAVSKEFLQRVQVSNSIH